MTLIDKYEGSFDGRNVLYVGQLAEVVLPPLPSIPPEEGVHCMVTSGHDAGDPPRAVAARYLLGLGVAKAIAESGITADAWVNTRLEVGQRLSVYGRTPENSVSWRKPVVTHGRAVTPLEGEHPSGDMARLASLLGRYLPLWERLAVSMELFPEPPPVGKDVFGDIGHAYKLWEGVRHDIVLIKQPHLDGWHFVVSPKEGFARQWQTRLPGRHDDVSRQLVQASVEGWAIAQVIWELFGRRGEIHNSGNWANQLQLIKESPKGRVSLERLRAHTKQEKRRHRPDIATIDTSLDTHTHTHVYIPRTSDVVTLPIMKREEAVERLASVESASPEAQELQEIIAHWDSLPKATAEDVSVAQSFLGTGKLSHFLAANLRGPLIQ